MRIKAFTLAEVLITLAIIGVVAAVSIPSVVANTQQKEFQTGLRKAVSVLNSAITMNMAIDGESPYENKNLYKYLGRHMAVMQTMIQSPVAKDEPHGNVSFYTTDGMRFEFSSMCSQKAYKMSLQENPDIKLREGFNCWTALAKREVGEVSDCSGNQNCARCGSYGLENNPDNTTTAPCLVVVDVNGDRKPFPKNISCYSRYDNSSPACAAQNVRKFADIDGIKLTDTFSIMITDKAAIPFGVAAQRAMYQAQKGK